MASKYTLANALAFLAITGSKRALHIDTRVSMIGYTKLEEYQLSYGDDSEPMTFHREVLTEEGLELAKTSRLWKAHQQLVSLGFQVDSNRRQKPYHISYNRWLDDQNRPLSAFTGAHGRAYAQEEDAAERRWEMKQVGIHKNGEA